ncbi:MAG: sigma-54 dependent transcriptional regulator [Pelovirga sp.]
MPSAKEKILLVEDDAALRKLLEEELKDAGFEVKSRDNAHSGLELLRKWQPDMVISDLRLPGADGLWLLEQAQDRTVAPEFIMMTAFGTVPQAVEALKRGAADFLTKPLDLDHLLLSVQRHLETRRLRRDVRRYRELLELDAFHGMIGRSEVMNQLFTLIRQIGKAQGPVLISGESGTGKDLVARAIHRESTRKDQPFVAVNCAAIPGELQESEFFGHTAGAFTGAGQARKGLFAEAEQGTLFLDEIGDMPLDLQAKLLRILQDGRVRQVGSNREVQIDVRIIAATNHDLEQAVKHGTFREDLYYRLETFQIVVPPLRERGDDLDLLAARFIDLFNVQQGRKVRGLSTEALEQLRIYPFPGNVRELRSALERAFAFSTDRDIGVRCLPERIRQARRTATPSPVGGGLFVGLSAPLPTLEEMANRYTEYVVTQLNGNKRQAAQTLDVSRATLYRRLEKKQDLPTNS